MDIHFRSPNRTPLNTSPHALQQLREVSASLAHLHIKNAQFVGASDSSSRLVVEIPDGVSRDEASRAALLLTAAFNEVCLPGWASKATPGEEPPPIIFKKLDLDAEVA